MGKKMVFMFELMLLSTVLSWTLAKNIGITQNQHLQQQQHQQHAMNEFGPTKSLNQNLDELDVHNLPQIRVSRSPTNQIRFGRSQPFVRFGRDGETTGSNIDKYARFARNGLDDNIRTRQQGQESKFIRFGRSQKGAIGPLKGIDDGGRSTLWWNFYRLARNPNAHIRFAGKRSDGGANTNNLHHNSAIPIEYLIEKFAHEQQQQQQQQTQQQQQQQQQLQQQPLHNTVDTIKDIPDPDHSAMLNDEDEQSEDVDDANMDIDANF